MTADGEVQVLKERLLDGLVRCSVVIGAPILLVNYRTLWAFGWSRDLAVYVICYVAVVLTALLRRRLPFLSRAAVLVSVLYIIASLSLVRFGQAGGGLLLLAALAVVSTVLFGTAGGLLAGGIAAASMAVVAFGFSTGRLLFEPEVAGTVNTRIGWMTVGPVFLVVVAFVVLCPGILEQRLQGTLDNLQGKSEDMESSYQRLSEEIAIRRRAEIEKSELEDRLAEAQKMEAIGRLAGGVAHDFNNLLTAIQGNTELALLRMGGEPGVRSYLETISRTVERGSNLTHQLLTLSREQMSDLKVFSVNDCVRDLEPLLRALLGQRNQVLLKLDCARDLILANRGQLEQILLNLAANARDAMPRGGLFTVTTFSEVLTEGVGTRWALRGQNGHQVVLSVTDTGEGMDEATAARAFEPFFTTKAPGRGTGLGLATVFGLLKRQGASLALTSASGEGTTVRVFLPAMDESTEVAVEEAISEVVVGGHERILFVEDDAAGRESVSQILSSLGYTVVSARSANEALRTLYSAPSEAPFDLLVTDFILPGSNGRELAENVQRRSPGTRVLIISGFTEDAVLRQIVVTRSVRFLAKPFSRSRLSQKVRKVLDEVQD
jgi:signal transduction histidine kinase/CheY-like chemotaxis protein